MRAVECEMVALDFESTGASPGFLNTPWQIGLVVVAQGKVDLGRQFHSLLKVPKEQPFNVYIPGRWAQLREEMASAPTLMELWPQLKPFLAGLPLIAHHAPTERSFLNHVFPLQPFGPWVDTLPIARRAFPHQPDFKLENLIPNLGLGKILEQRCPDLAPHDAWYDAVACGTLLESVLQSPGWREATVENLASLG